MSSIQSVAGQPVSPPLSKPTHHGVLPSATIWSLRAMRSSQVVGDLVAGGVEVVLRVPDHALEVDVGRQAVVLAVVLAERHERLAEEVVELVDVEAQVLERHDVPASARSAMAPGCGTAATSSVPPSAWIWNCWAKSLAGLDLDVVVGLGVDQLVEDLLVGVGLLGLAGAQQLDGAGVLARAPPPSPPSSVVPPRRRRRRRRRRTPAATSARATSGISSRRRSFSCCGVSLLGVMIGRSGMLAVGRS